MTFRQYIKDQLRENPDWKPTYARDKNGRELKMGVSIKVLRQAMGLNYKLRGRGWTRPFKKQSKVRRQMAKQSRRINRA